MWLNAVYSLELYLVVYYTIVMNIKLVVILATATKTKQNNTLKATHSNTNYFVLFIDLFIDYFEIIFFVFAAFIFLEILRFHQLLKSLALFYIYFLFSIGINEL